MYLYLRYFSKVSSPTLFKIEHVPVGSEQVPCSAKLKHPNLHGWRVVVVIVDLHADPPRARRRVRKVMRRFRRRGSHYRFRTTHFKCLHVWNIITANGWIILFCPFIHSRVFEEMTCYLSRDWKTNIQRSEKWLVRGWVKFIPALAYLFCLTLPGSCLTRYTQPFFTSL